MKAFWRSSEALSLRSLDGSDNDPSWRAAVKGSIRVGAAALDPNQLRKLRMAAAKYLFKNPYFTQYKKAPTFAVG